MSNNEPPPRNRSTALPSHLPFPVVGIGASAGAVETLKVFFENMPSNPGMAFVVVVHLSPKHESVLDRILQTCTSMPVVQVTKHTSIEADHVYVIPPAARLEMNDSYLRVQHAVRAQGDPVAIDEFFRTLADVHKTRAVGIVLTGGGSDGSVGLSRIKEQGGITLAQDPDDAMHDTMPRSAIATGAVDIVLPVSAIPARLLAIAKNMGRIHIPPPADLQRDAGERPDEGHETANDRAALRDILAMLRARTGHDFKHYKKATVLRRIERRMQVTGLPDMPAYAAMLHEKPDETPKLLSDMLIGVTQFFRDRESFEILEQRIVGNLFGGDNGPAPTHVRTWVAGCSSGEEAYSVAMLLCAAADARNAAPKIQVFATDIDEFSLVIGRAGVYPGAIETDVPAARLQQFFTREGSNYRVRKELRERVLFAPHNVLRDPPFSKLDLVSCRNLLIYLDREVQADVLRMFHFALKPGGYLFLGSSESADACENLFAVVDKRHRIYQAKNTASQHRPVPLLPIAGTDKLPQASVPVHAVRGNRTSFADIHRQALEHYAPPSVIVDRDSNIVHMSERAGRFLPRLFEMYSQDRGQDGLRGRMGLGIGLAVVHQLVQAHGGRIEAASDGKGKGSTFTVWLPLSAHAYGPADPAGVPPEAAALEGIAILLVDDSPEILDTFGALLEMEGARVDTASSGQAGLDALARTAFDIVISDLGMPEMDGYGFLNAMRQKNIATPAIALSGYGAKRDVDKAMSAGFTAHLGKPVPLEQLVKVIRQTLAREETRQAGE